MKLKEKIAVPVFFESSRGGAGVAWSVFLTGLNSPRVRDTGELAE